jgi:Bor protein
MRRSCSMLLLGLVAVLSGCYHATVETGAKPSTVMVEKKWASGWIFGLVPPKTIETQAKCNTGVSKVETQLSFLNMLVSALTLNIYSPMDIRVTCAEGASGSALVSPADSVSATSQPASALGTSGSP